MVAFSEANIYKKGGVYLRFLDSLIPSSSVTYEKIEIYVSFNDML